MTMHAGGLGGATSVATTAFPLTPTAGTAFVNVNSVTLVDDAAGVLAQKSGAVAQTFRVYGDATKYTYISHDGTNGSLLTSSGGLSVLANGAFINFGSSNTTEWQLSGTGIAAQANRRFSIGTSALATNATEGFLHFQSCAGVPTGTPASIPTGQIPAVIDSITKQLAVYSAAWFNLTRTLQVDAAAVGNVLTGTDDLISYTMPANVLGRDGKCLRIKAWGSTANNGNAKTLTLNFGSQTVVSTALTTSIAGMWEIESTVIRTASGAQDIVARTLQGATLIFDQELTGGTQTDTAQIIIKCTGTATGTNDIVQEGLVVEVIN